MFRRLGNITRWPAVAVLGLAGLMAVGLAFVSVNLLSHGMANLSLIRRHGLLALREGAALQLGELAAAGLLAMLCYFGFKFCEVELSVRYRRWCEEQRAKAGPAGTLDKGDED